MANKNIAWVVWRDIIFVITCSFLSKLLMSVETHPGDTTLIQRLFGDAIFGDTNIHTDTIVDSGFILTTPLYNILKNNRVLNDVLAALNSMALFVANLYPLKVTFYDADYSLAFRMVATQVFRGFCGWFTFLPPSKEFLPSYYDFPESIYCLAGTVDCTKPLSDEPLPFLTFFSGHVAMTVIMANHMYLHSWVKSAIALHVVNVLQIIRLLATRGHYSIDMIIGWVVAVYVSNPAERLGLFYSKGGMRLGNLAKVKFTPIAFFEKIAGIRETKRGIRSKLSATEEDILNILEPSKNDGHTLKLASTFLQKEFQDLNVDRRLLAQELQSFDEHELKSFADVYTFLGSSVANVKEARGKRRNSKDSKIN